MLDGVEIKEYVSPRKNNVCASPALRDPSLLWQERDEDSAELSFSSNSKQSPS